MVALLRFLEHGEIFVEFLFGFERRAVNALELRIFFVAFVISAGDARESEMRRCFRCASRAGRRRDR